MPDIITKGRPGERVLLLGNEAIARGAVESNVEIAAAYPGTPSSEITETLARVADGIGMHVQWSTNEMVAFEVAIGGALCGKRSMASMKHVGVNWITDPLIHSAYHGFNAGLVVVSADDPSGHSSSNEQDNRYMAQFAEVPVLEPSNTQEAKDYLCRAFDLSEEVRLPVILRPVTRLCHSRGDVVLGEVRRLKTEPKFHDDYYTDFVMKEGIVGPKVIPQMHAILHSKLEKVEGAAAKMGLFTSEAADAGAGTPGSDRIGIITASVGANYTLDFLQRRNLRGKVGLLKLGLTYPFPVQTVRKFMEGFDRVAVVEEGEPFIERNLIPLAEGRQICGKLTSHLPGTGELTYAGVDRGLSSLLNLQPEAVPPEKQAILDAASKLLTPRTLTMCAGCPHRAAYYAAKKAIRTTANARHIAMGDIGCYTLGMYPPLRFMQDVFCMGGSIGIANGIAQTGVKEPVIATIGDSTFYHAGIPALINATFNKANIKVMVMDNEVTAMTGYQPHPGCGETATLKPTKKVTIEEICRACGIEFVRIVDPYDMDGSVRAMEDAIKFDGPAVVIFRRLCTQERLRLDRGRGAKAAAYAVGEKCIGCRTCVAAFGCPAIGFDKGRKRSYIDPLGCTGCGVCAWVCPQGAITSGSPRKSGGG